MRGANCNDQGRRNGFKNGGDHKSLITFLPFVIQTSNLQFWKWQDNSQNMVGTNSHVPIYSGGPVKRGIVAFP